MLSCPVYNSEMVAISSPCVRLCCLDEQDICLGCLRHVDEITAWAAADEEQRRTILVRCERRRRERDSDLTGLG